MLVRMAVSTLAIDRNGGPCAVVLESTDPNVRLPIIIPREQATAIAASQVQLSRPLSHDLIVRVLAHLGGCVTRVLIHDLREGIYFASLYVRSATREGVLDCRPSDAIALAVRLELPIWVDTSVLAQAPGASRGSDSREEGETPNRQATAPGATGDTRPQVAASENTRYGAEERVPLERLEVFRPLIERLPLDDLDRAA
jgi:uncharacterized protein